MAQTVRYWKAGSTDLGVAASFHDGVYGASAVPIASNVVYFTEGADNISGSLTTLNLALAGVFVTKGFTGRIGSNGTSATVAANTNGGAAQYATETFDYSAGGGYAYVTAGTNGIDLVRVDGLGKLYLTGGTVSNLLLSRGQLDMNDQVDLSGKSMTFYGGESSVDWKADGTDPTLTITGGTHLLRRTFGNTTISGGIVTIQVEKETNFCTGTFTLNGGTVILKSGNLGATAFVLNDGALVLTEAIRALDLSAATITAGNTAIDQARAGGAKISWPATTSLVFGAGAAANFFARVSTASV